MTITAKINRLKYLDRIIFIFSTLLTSGIIVNSKQKFYKINFVRVLIIMNRIEEIANQLSCDSNNALLIKQFDEVLYICHDIAYLFELAYRYTPKSDISLPIYQRILSIQPENIQAIVDVGFIYWLDGNDRQARACLQEAMKKDAENIHVLTLQAALEPDKDKKAAIYQQILTLNPDDEVAQKNLQILLAP